MIYILDTNIISYIIKNHDFELLDKLEDVGEDNTIAISSITIAELFYGIRKKGSKKLEVLVSEFLLPLQRLSFDEAAAFEYSSIRSDLEKSGNIIRANDLLIATHAKSINAILATNNTKEFERVKNLKIENWTEKKAK